MVSHHSANHGPSCLTSVILRELAFPTWYCPRSLSWYRIGVLPYLSWYQQRLTQPNNWTAGQCGGTCEERVGAWRAGGRGPSTGCDSEVPVLYL